jgi:hypothetical protein
LVEPARSAGASPLTDPTSSTASSPPRCRARRPRGRGRTALTPESRSPGRPRARSVIAWQKPGERLTAKP